METAAVKAKHNLKRDIWYRTRYESVIRCLKQKVDGICEMLGFTKDGEEGQLNGCLCGKRGELCSPGNLGAKDFAYAYPHIFVCLLRLSLWSNG